MNLLFKDYRNHDNDSWTTVFVVNHEPPPGPAEEEDVLKKFAHLIQEAGSSGAGQIFWHEPFVQIFENHTVVTQSGGRDV